MAKIKNLIRLSDHYKVDPEKLELLWILNPLLTMDTKLFIDPLLLESSKHSEIRKDSVITFRLSSSVAPIVALVAIHKSFPGLD